MANGERRRQGGAQETELKLSLCAEDTALLRVRLDLLATAQRDRVDSTYYDTPDLLLARNRAALRLRRIGAGKRLRWVQTLKTEDECGDAALSTRGEWEISLPGATLDPERFAATPLSHILPAKDAVESLRPLFRTVFVRTVWLVSAYGAQVEVALDVGEIRAGRRRSPILEAELELCSGPATALTSLALDLSGATGRKKKADLRLLPYGDSKAARGYRLATAKSADPDPAKPMPASRAVADAGRIDIRDGVDAVCRRLVGAAMTVVLANADGLVGSDDPEYVHQARVALRRMRAATGILAQATAAAPGAGLSFFPKRQVRQIRQWARRFGAARDWDVFCSETLPDLYSYGRETVADANLAQDRAESAVDPAVDSAAGPVRGSRRAHFPEEEMPRPWQVVLRRARSKRDRARARLRAQIAGPEFAQWALELLHWSAAPPCDSAPLRAVVPDVVGRSLSRFSAQGVRFARLSGRKRHALRIAAKRLRYVLEAVPAAFAKKAARDAMHALEQFQDAAGRGVDAVAAQEAIARLTRSTAIQAQARKWGRARQRDAARRATHWSRQLADSPICPRS